MPKNPDELGALWSRTGAKGAYMTGEINGVKVVCFPVNKKHDRQPDWRVMKSKPRERVDEREGASDDQIIDPFGADL